MATPPIDYAALLAAAQKQMLLLASGQAVVAVETPQLGRVVYNQTDIASLQRLIDYLTVQVDPSAAVYVRRRPLSFEACP